jgi:hypothetical protein
MSLIRDLDTWYDVPAQLPAEEAIRQAFQGYKAAWPAGFLVMVDKQTGMTHPVLSEWIEANRIGKARLHSHSAIAIAFFEVYEDALAFYMTYAK